MSYLIETTPRADRDLAPLEPQLAAAILDHLVNFAKQPSAFPTKSRPYPRVGQWFQFTISFGGDTYWIGTLYQYTQDEQYLSFDRIYVEML